MPLAVSQICSFLPQNLLFLLPEILFIHSLITCYFLSFKSQLKCHLLERSKHWALNFLILEQRHSPPTKLLFVLSTINQLIDQGLGSTYCESGTVLGIEQAVMNCLTWSLTLWSLHSLGTWQSSNTLDLGRRWAGKVRQDDVSLRKKLGCPQIPCQEFSFVSALWFLICSFMSSDSEGKRINFQSDPKALQEHH